MKFTQFLMEGSLYRHIPFRLEESKRGWRQKLPVFLVHFNKLGGSLAEVQTKDERCMVTERKLQNDTYSDIDRDIQINPHLLNAFSFYFIKIIADVSEARLAPIFKAEFF